jgi:hypothetical protein
MVDETLIEDFKASFAADAARQVAEAIAADPELNNPEQLADWQEGSMDSMDEAISDIYRADDPDAMAASWIDQLVEANQPPADPVDEETDAALVAFDSAFPDKTPPEGRQQDRVAGMSVGMRMTESLSQSILERAAQYGTPDQFHRKARQMAEDEEESMRIIAEAQAAFEAAHE